MKNVEQALKYASFSIFLCTGILTKTAFAQDQRVTLEEVIVTAQKREQNVQDVPIAISAFDNKFIVESGVTDIMQLQAFAPGLSVYSEYSPLATSFNIRGLGTTASSVSLESSVGLYIDGVYRSRQASGIGDLVDIERVEVLKGPQGTLFGKNTVAGAVQFLTVAPVLDEWGGFAEFRVGSENLRKFSGAINIPLVDGRAAARVSGGGHKRDGYVENIVTGTELNEKDRYSIRAQLLFKISDSLTARLIADHSEIEENCCGGSNVYDGPTDSIAGFNPAAGLVLPIEAVAGRPVVLADDFDKYEVAYDEEPYYKLEESGLSLELNWELENATFTSLTAYRRYEDFDRSADFMPVDFASRVEDATNFEVEQDTFTQEFRLDGTWGENVNYVTGFYYFDQEIDRFFPFTWGEDANTLLTGGLTLGTLDAFGVFAPAGTICTGEAFPGMGVEDLCPLPAFPPGEGATNTSNQEQTSWAVFGQADFKISDKWVATLGLRYLDEEKELSAIFEESIFTPVFAAIPLISPFIDDLDGVKLDDTATTGTAKLAYFWNDDVMTYISYGRGYKSGGTNTDRIPAETGAQQLFDPETSDSWEVGIKSDLLDKRLRINAAVYYMELDDFQANNFVGNTFVLQNAGAIETQGFELDLMALPASWLSINAGIAHVDAEYADFQTSICAQTPFGMEPDADQPGFPNICDVTGNQVGGIPEWSAYGSFRTERMIDGDTLYAQFDVNWRDEMPSGIDSSGDPNHVSDSLTLANLRIGYRFGDERYNISLWCTNCADESYYAASYNSPFRVGSITAFHTEPRMWGATLRVDY